MLLEAIADDLTGATDLALSLSREGTRTLQFIGVPRHAIATEDADAVVQIVGDAVARVRHDRRPVLVEALVRRDVDVVGDASEAVEAGVAAAIDAAVAFARASPEPAASTL